VRKRHPPEVLEREDSCGDGRVWRGVEPAGAVGLDFGALHEERPSGGESIVTNHYLLKTEATVYSFANLVKDRETEWDGVSNPTAVKNLREMEPGARLIIYETGDVKSAVGTATVVSVNAKDPKKPVVKIKAGKALTNAVSLEAIKKEKIFKESPLVRIGRLSVVPLTAEQYEWLVGS
jgi:predicted RNA-binding protein with PUA-like domain